MAKSGPVTVTATIKLYPSADSHKNSPHPNHPQLTTTGEEARGKQRKTKGGAKRPRPRGREPLAPLMAMASPFTAGSTSAGCQHSGTGRFCVSPLQRRPFSLPLRSPVPVSVGGAAVGRGMKWRSRGVATAAASMGGGGREPLPPEAVTFSATISTDLPLYDSPEASFEEYLDDRPRIFGAMFPDSRRCRRLNDEEWRVQMLPIQFLFASVNPVVVMRLRCRSHGRGYPPEVPLHVPRVLELRATRWELQELGGGLVPPHFALDVRGLLYPDRGEEGDATRRSRLKGHLETSISLVLPPVLALVPEHVLRGVAESVLRRLVGRMKQEVDGSLLSDFQSFRRERLRKPPTRKKAAQQQPPAHVHPDQRAD